MNKTHIEQLAKDFCEIEGIIWIPGVIDTYVKFTEHLIEKGEVVSCADYQRFRNEYKGEADLEALCCAVADVENDNDAIKLSNEKHIENLEKQVAFYVKIVDKFIDKDTATSANVISDEDITSQMNIAYKEAGHNAYYGNGFISGAEWMREQLIK